MGKGAAGRARLVADGGGLENRYGITPIVGSNPTPSASDLRFHVLRRPADVSGGRASGGYRRRSSPVLTRWSATSRTFRLVAIEARASSWNAWSAVSL